MEHPTYKDCIGCGECELVCPEQTPIAAVFALLKELDESGGFEALRETFQRDYRRITGCVGCGRCLPRCPVKINIPYYILDAKETFE